VLTSADAAAVSITIVLELLLTTVADTPQYSTDATDAFGSPVPLIVRTSPPARLDVRLPLIAVTVARKSSRYPFGSVPHVLTLAPLPPIVSVVLQSLPSQLYIGQFMLNATPASVRNGVPTLSVPPFALQNVSPATTALSPLHVLIPHAS
jgi:hypothetical protein